MDITVSSKYQIVIPKAVRKQLDLKVGQKLQISKVTSTGITLSKQPTAEEYVELYAGTLTGAPWQKADVDAAVWLRQERDNDR